jgi:hypothetical protein
MIYLLQHLFVLEEVCQETGIPDSERAAHGVRTNHFQAGCFRFKMAQLRIETVFQGRSAVREL